MSDDDLQRDVKAARSSQKRTLFGVWVGTGVYLFFLAGLFAVKLDTKAMTLNEWGDFLAGGAAPLAFLWLIAGFYLQRTELTLQRIELVQNTAALEAQVAETARLAQQAENAADRAVQQDHAEYMESQPVFVQVRASKQADHKVLTFKVTGNDCYNLRRVDEYGRESEVISPHMVADTNHAKVPVSMGGTTDLRFLYKDVTSKNMFQTVRWDGQKLERITGPMPEAEIPIEGLDQPDDSGPY